jgi:signal transduction histidine kinase/FixJ family two-component response regulator
MFPMAAITNPVPSCSPPNALEPAKHRLLIIDDAPGIHDDFRKILRRPETSDTDEVEKALFGSGPIASAQRRFLIDSAFQGSEGLDLVRRAVKEGRPYALAFVDVRMPPGWDGIETAQRLWEADPDLQIVICTAYSDYSWGEMASKLGQSELLMFLKKPFDTVEVLQLAHTLTAKWTLSRQAQRRLEELDRLVAERTQQVRAANQELLADIAVRKQTEFRLSAFAALGNRLSAARNAKGAAEIIGEVADELIGWDACLCELYSPTEDRLIHLLSMDSIDGRRTECGREGTRHIPAGMARQAIDEGGQLILREIEFEPPPEGLLAGERAGHSASILCVPIRTGGRIIGVLSIQSYTARAYDHHSLETLQALADHCGAALNRIKSEETLRQTEQQLRQAQKMEAIGQLAGGVAHDFNNLLAIILGNAELAAKDGEQLSANTTECLRQIGDAADRAANLTRQLLAFGRKQVVRAEPLNLNTQITQLSKMLKRIIGEDIQLQSTYGENLPLVRADAGMLDQVIMNLVVNSRDAMPSGGQLCIATRGVEFDASAIQTHPEGRAGSFVCLSVMDTGTGIAPEHFARIFEPFFTTKEVGKGTGLGLATVFGIVKQHQGWIEVTSNAGAGTIFQVFLPALEASASEPARSGIRTGLPGGHEVILLVEDDNGVRRISRRFLEEAGYHVLEASCGQEALDVFVQHAGKIDFLLTDIVMPGGMNGPALADHLTLASPSLKVLFMSGYSGDIPEDALGAVPQPNRRFLRKPCARHELLRVIRDYLDERLIPATTI